MPLRLKLALSYLFIGLFPVLAMAFTVYWQASKALQEQTLNSLEAVANIKQAQLLDNLQARSSVPSPWTAGFERRAHASVPRMIAAAGGSHWSSFWRELDAQQVHEAQALGLRVLAWTVNRADDMHRMLGLGVDGIVTDRPDIAMVVWRERGLIW